jgi:hypothetical protein
LEELFLQILDKLSPKQLQTSARFFQILGHAHQEVSSLELSFADESAESIYSMEIAPLDHRDIEARLDILRRRVNDCCKRLIEISTREGKVDPDGYVSYLHRTVSDFWKKAENEERLIRLQGGDFNPTPTSALPALL